MKLYVKKQSDYFYEIWESEKEITLDNWKENEKDILRIYNQDFLKFIKDPLEDKELQEIKPSEEMIKALMRHKLLQRITNAVGSIIQDTPFSQLKGLEKIVVTYDWDLSSYSEWDDGFKDGIC